MKSLGLYTRNKLKIYYNLEKGPGTDKYYCTNI